MFFQDGYTNFYPTHCGRVGGGYYLRGNACILWFGPEEEVFDVLDDAFDARHWDYLYGDADILELDMKDRSYIKGKAVLDRLKSLERVG